MADTLETGSISWIDLTVPDAEGLRDFYAAVVGWKPQAVSMDNGAYHDFSMLAPESAKAAAGICHARGVNADLPPVWLIYITVEDLEASLKTCTDRGKVVAGPKNLGHAARYAVIQDPAGAVCALFQSTEE